MFNTYGLSGPTVVLLGLLLTACGGGGGGAGGAPPSPPATPISVTPMVVGGSGFSFALKRDGTVVSWGDQQNGTLGNGRNVASSTSVPNAVLNLTAITQIAAGNNHGIARRNDGAVFVWGANSAGQLGVGGGGAIATPVQLNLSNIIAVAAGGDSSFALRDDGVVFAWGSNNAGQLGLNDNNLRVSPVQIPNLTGVSAIAAGGSHALALRVDKTVFAWGNNLDGQLGLNDTLPRRIPTQVIALNNLNVTKIAAGQLHSLALTGSGTVRAWGANHRGQLGNGFGGSRLLPVQVLNLTRVAVAIAAGANHSLALLDDETMRTWGNNSFGQLGIGTSGTSTSTNIPQLPLATVIAIGSGDDHSLAIMADGRVGCFGNNFFSECGQPSGFSEFTTPIEVGSPALNVNQ